jgi:uncharacterized protein YndB with AHSA1/START domain
MLKKLALALAIGIVVLLAFAATRPNDFRIERTTLIQAPPEKVFALVNDFHQWEAWSPWEKVDPQLKRTYTGAASGAGAIYEWRGNKDIGAGRMAIVESVPSSRILIDLDFVTPFEAHNKVAFTLVPQGAATVVTQAMYGPSPFVSKLMGLFFSMDKMVGDKYEEGLGHLKAQAEH